MQNFGFYFGLPMGFVLFGILQVYPALVGPAARRRGHRLGRQLASASR